MSASSSNENINPNDTFKILIATDIHLGYEHNKRKGHELNDSFTTFEEILQYGKQYEVDFVLLGGDLFHDTKPSQPAVLKCMDLLRKYCLGARENKIQFLSDPEIIFRHCAHKTVNYEDPNYNVSMPVFSIHGNHDDPSFSAVGSMDLLSVSGLINYFGKWTDLTRITIPPLIMKKGETYISLYGLSYINDQRLSRLFRDVKVEMLRPEGIDQCFNMFVLHQNRVRHDDYAYIPENKLPEFLNFVVWGHEHECRISPELVSDAQYFICQPGSSIATSLCEAESKLKHVGILSVNKTNFKLKKLRLKTVRPFVFDNLILHDQDIPKNYARPLADSIYKFVDDYIEDKLIPKAAEQLTGHASQPIQPLIRLRIFHRTDEEVFDVMRLSQKYCDEIANPMDMIVFRKEKVTGSKSKSSTRNISDEIDDFSEIFDYQNVERNWETTVQGGVKKYFDLDENKDKLTVLTVTGLNEALNRYVEKGDTDAFRDIVTHQMRRTMKHLETCDVESTESICEAIKEFRDRRRERHQEEHSEISSILNDPSRQYKKAATDDLQGSDGDSGGMSDDVGETRAVGRGRGRGASKGTRARGRGSRGGRGKTKATAKDPLDITLRSPEPPKTRKPIKKQEQSTLQRYMTSQPSQSSDVQNYVFLDDSD